MAIIMKRITVVFLASSFLTSCASYKMMPGTTIVAKDGMKQLHNPNAEISINYYGDYDFHKPKKKLFLMVYSKHLKNSISKNTTTVIYSAHTTIAPSSATIGLYYPQTSIEELIAKVSADLTDKLEVSSFEKSTDKFGKKDLIILTYKIENLNYIEYLSSIDGNAFRIIFWTDNQWQEWLENETKGIIQSLNNTPDSENYFSLIKTADFYYRAKDYEKSLELFQRAFQQKSDNPTHLYNASCSAALAEKKDTAFELLEQAFQNGWTNINHLKNDPDLKTLHNDDRWTSLINKMQQKADEMEANFDKPLRAELLEIFQNDQGIRHEYLEAANDHGYDHPSVDSLAKIMLNHDSINLIKVTRILDERGWVGPGIVGGQANAALFLVIQHAPLEAQKKYLPMMREAVKNGDARVSSLALLEDRIALREGRKQIYGSQIGRNPETGEHYVSPLKDPDNVDKRRAEVGLGPIAEYVKRWGITWDVEEYKKQLPELEKLKWKEKEKVK